MDQHELAFPAGGSFREAAGPPAGPWADPAGPGGSGRPQSVGTKIGSVAHVTCWVFCLFLRTGSSFLKSHPCVPLRLLLLLVVAGREGQSRAVAALSVDAQSSWEIIPRPASSKDRTFLSWWLWAYPPSCLGAEGLEVPRTTIVT